VATKFCTVAPDICGSLARNLLVTLTVPRILRWPLHFCKLSATLHTHTRARAHAHTHVHTQGVLGGICHTSNSTLPMWNYLIITNHTYT
jgi:hypothetical protein